MTLTCGVALAATGMISLSTTNLSSGTVKDQFLLSGENVVHGFYTHQHRVIHVSNFLAPGAKAAARVDSLFEQRRLQYSQSLVPSQCRDRIRIIHHTMIA